MPIDRNGRGLQNTNSWFAELNLGLNDPFMDGIRRSPKLGDR